MQTGDWRSTTPYIRVDTINSEGKYEDLTVVMRKEDIDFMEDSMEAIQYCQEGHDHSNLNDEIHQIGRNLLVVSDRIMEHYDHTSMNIMRHVYEIIIPETIQSLNSKNDCRTVTMYQLEHILTNRICSYLEQTLQNENYKRSTSEHHIEEVNSCKMMAYKMPMECFCARRNTLMCNTLLQRTHAAHEVLNDPTTADNRSLMVDTSFDYNLRKVIEVLNTLVSELYSQSYYHSIIMRLSSKIKNRLTYILKGSYNILSNMLVWPFGGKISIFRFASIAKTKIKKIGAKIRRKFYDKIFHRSYTEYKRHHPKRHVAKSQERITNTVIRIKLNNTTNGIKHYVANCTEKIDECASQVAEMFINDIMMKKALLEQLGWALMPTNMMLLSKMQAKNKHKPVSIQSINTASRSYLDKIHYERFEACPETPVTVTAISNFKKQIEEARNNKYDVPKVQKDMNLASYCTVCSSTKRITQLLLSMERNKLHKTIL